MKNLNRTVTWKLLRAFRVLRSKRSVEWLLFFIIVDIILEWILNTKVDITLSLLVCFSWKALNLLQTVVDTSVNVPSHYGFEWFKNETIVVSVNGSIGRRSRSHGDACGVMFDPRSLK